MKVVCDNCRAVYKVPDAKLTKPVNKATCRGCGHRMLIPKPSPNQDDDERTLVTAVPPTPPPADPRSEGPATRPIVDEPEATLPGRPATDDVKIYPGTPLPTSSRSQASPGQTTVTAPPPAAATLPEHPAPMANNPGQVPETFDPASDLTWAMLSTVGTILGALVLLATDFAKSGAMFGSPYYAPALNGVGVFMIIGGAFTSLLILSTGQRGRQKAQVLLSTALGGLLGGLLSIVLVAGPFAALQVLEQAEGINFSAASPPDEGTTPDLAVATADEEEGEEGEEGEEEEAGDDGEEEEEASNASSTPDPSSAGSTQPSPRPSSAPAPVPTSSAATSAPSPQPTAAPSPQPAPAPVPAPAPAPQGVPTDVIHVILSNNINVKKCFVPLLQAGSLPPRVDVNFTLQPTGKASEVKIVQSQWSGGDFEGCMRGAIGGVGFPPFSGAPQRITYPFVLR